MQLFSILINTTDSFEDSWTPFFTLFKKYWPDFNGTIYLNTETKDFSFEGLNIVPVKNNIKTPTYKPTWSECLIRALDNIPNAIVLYMQEDYFLHDFVNDNLVSKFAQLINSTGIDCIQLTDQATLGSFQKTNYEQLLEIDQNAPYRISTQAALWKKDVLKQYIRKYESAWQFEHYATKRASIFKHNIYNVDTSIYIKGQNEIIPYIFTGIIRGKWNIEMVNLSKIEELKIDFDKRGFYNPNVSNSFNVKIKKYISMKNIQTKIISELELLFLKIIALLKSK